MGIKYLNLSSFIQISTIKRPHPCEILAQTDPPPPEGSEFRHILPCCASTVRDRKEFQLLDTGFPTSHQPRFYAAPNFLKMGINYLNLSSWTISIIKDEKFTAKFHCIKTIGSKVVAHSIAFRVVSVYWQGVAPFPWYLNAKGPTPIGSSCVAHTSPHSAAVVTSLHH